MKILSFAANVILAFVIYTSSTGLAEQIPPAEQVVFRTLNGIPMHEIPVQKYADAEFIIKVDGKVEEQIWETVPAYDNMIVTTPFTGQPGAFATKIRMAATDKGMYVSSVMFQPNETLTRRLSARDQFLDRDVFGFTMDTSGEGLFAYWFMVALGDSLTDGKVLPERRYENDWDGAWLGRSAEFEGGWSVEMFLPWSMFNIPKGDGPRDIGFAASRHISSFNERYQWPGHPYSTPQFVTALNNFVVDGVQPKKQFSLIPYVAAVQDSARDRNEIRGGFDLNWKPSTLLELTLSLNPDFGAVEADDVVLNLTALETFFPEKRLFFLEGNEVFATTPRSNSGNAYRELSNEDYANTSRRAFVSDFFPSPLSLLNTRRIGGTFNQMTLPADVNLNRGERDLPTDLLGAVKFTGSYDDLRYGILAAAEDESVWLGTDALGKPVDVMAEGREFSVVRFLYEKSERNRVGIGYLGTLASGPQYDAQVHGLDLHYALANGNLSSDLQLIASDVDGLTGHGGVLDIRYVSSQTFQHKLEFDYFDQSVDINDLGFLSRNNYRGAQYVWSYTKPASGKLNKGTRGTLVVRHQSNLSAGQVIDSGIYWRQKIELPGRNTFRSLFAYLPEYYEDLDSRGNGAYRAEKRLYWNLLWATDASKMFSFSSGFGRFQENLGGWSGKASAGVTMRFTDSLYMDFDVKYTRRKGWIVHQGQRYFGAYDGLDWQPSVDVNWFLTPGHQLRFSLQWAGVKMSENGFYTVPEQDGDLVIATRTQPDHDFTVSLLTTQIRYRWEIAPLTDLFVVYNRGNQLPFRHRDEFSELFSDTFQDPIVNTLIAKFRYRFGN